jgi:predicted DNA-binding transcriptional regulator AlpA
MSGNVPKLLRIKDLERLTQIASWRWYELFAAGQGPEHLRIGRTIRVTEAALVAWIAEQEAATRNGKGLP